MLHDTLNITPSKGKRIIHIETPLGIVNIRLGLRDKDGREVEAIEAIPDVQNGVIWTRQRFVRREE